MRQSANCIWFQFNRFKLNEWIKLTPTACCSSHKLTSFAIPHKYLETFPTAQLRWRCIVLLFHYFFICHSKLDNDYFRTMRLFEMFGRLYSKNAKEYWYQKFVWCWPSEREVTQWEAHEILEKWTKMLVKTIFFCNNLMKVFRSVRVHGVDEIFLSFKDGGFPMYICT